MNINFLFALVFSFIPLSPLKADNLPKEIVLADSGDKFLNGVVQEVGKRAFDKYNINFKLKTFPAARALISANSGEVDGDAYRVVDFHKKTGGKFPNLIRVDAPYLSIYFTAFVEDKNKDIVINDWKDLAPYKVAVIRGNKTMEARVNEFVPKAQQSVVTFYDEAFKMLLLKRVDVVIGKPIIGAKYLKENKNLHMRGKFQFQDIYIYLHKKHKDLIPKIEAELRHLKTIGALADIEKGVRNRLMN